VQRYLVGGRSVQDGFHRPRDQTGAGDVIEDICGHPARHSDLEVQKLRVTPHSR